jgi:hypothetical protein
MQTTLLPPTTERVLAACDKFDQQSALSEQSLEELFRQYPSNADPRHVLLKVVAVNSLYHTMIFALETVANHIHAHHQEIDTALAVGEPGIVDKIARVRVNGKAFNFFSFASKYSSWHNATAYPIYDSHVEHYLWTLQKQNHFSSFLRSDLWEYPKFLGVMTSFRSFHELDSLSFKQIDKFLYLEGGVRSVEAPQESQSGPGAFDFFPADEAGA